MDSEHTSRNNALPPRQENRGRAKKALTQVGKLKYLRYFFNQSLRGLNIISVILIFLMALWVTADVMGRYFFLRPIHGTTELVKAGVVVIVFLGMAYTLQRQRHIRTTLIMQRVSPTTRTWFEILAFLLGAVIFFLLVCFSAKDAWTSWLVREFEGEQLRVPLYPSRFAIAIGGALMCIQCILDFFRSICDLIKR